MVIDEQNPIMTRNDMPTMPLIGIDATNANISSTAPRAKAVTIMRGRLGDIPENARVKAPTSDPTPIDANSGPNVPAPAPKSS